MDTRQHVQIIAWLNIATGVVILLSAIGVFISMTMGGLFSGNPIEMLASPIGAVFCLVFIALFSAPYFLCGKGLLEHKGWARVLAMVLGVLHFFNFPLGTAFCIYTFWALWGKDADPYFEGIYPSRHEAV